MRVSTIPKKETAPKGGHEFLVNLILPTINTPCKVRTQTREIRMYSQTRLRILTVLNQLTLPFCIKLEELADLLAEPIGRTQAGLYALMRSGLIEYTFLTGAGYVVTSVQKTDGETGCPYHFSSCEMCVFKNAACKGNMVMKGAEDA